MFVCFEGCIVGVVCLEGCIQGVMCRKVDSGMDGSLVELIERWEVMYLFVLVQCVMGKPRMTADAVSNKYFLLPRMYCTTVMTSTPFIHSATRHSWSDRLSKHACRINSMPSLLCKVISIICSHPQKSKKSATTENDVMWLTPAI